MKHGKPYAGEEMIMEKTDLQIAVEAELGVDLCPVFFAQAERYARRKLEVANQSAGREWGEDGYREPRHRGVRTLLQRLTLP